MRMKKQFRASAGIDMSDTQINVVVTREGAHAASMMVYTIAKTLIADGKRVKITVGEECDPVSVKQRRFLHGPVLTQIAEQVCVGKERYVTAIWKEYFRKLFLGDRWEMRRTFKVDPDTGKLTPAKRATPHRVRNSTEELNVKKYSEYIDRVIAHATLEWNVAFAFDESDRNAVRYQKPVRAKEFSHAE